MNIFHQEPQSQTQPQKQTQQQQDTQPDIEELRRLRLERFQDGQYRLPRPIDSRPPPNNTDTDTTDTDTTDRPDRRIQDILRHNSHVRDLARQLREKTRQ